MSFNTPYATTGIGDGLYGEVKGSSADWRSSAFLDKGKSHQAASTSTCTLRGGLGAFVSSAAPPERRLAKHVDGPQTSCLLEPLPRGGLNAAALQRRALSSDATAYRPTIRIFEPPTYVDRPSGKKLIPEPYGAPPRPEGVQIIPQARPVEYAQEPGMPRLSRPHGATILRESDQELSYEHAFGRKVRVGQDTYRGAGRAGDTSLSFAPPRRPEDTDPAFFKSLKDAPTFIRFVQSLPPKPAVSPHQRHEAQQRRARETELKAERDLVASLHLPDEEEDTATS